MMGAGDGQLSPPVRRRDKILAACTGATVTSLTMTPFDVVKTRLQTAPVAPPLFQPSPSLAGIATCCQPTYFSTNSSDLACRFDPRGQTSTSTSASTVASHSRLSVYTTAVSMSCEFPDAPEATRRLGSIPSSSSGLWSMLTTIVKVEGPTALWRGVAPALAMSIPAQAVYMVGYDSLRRAAFVNAPRIAYLDPYSSNRPLANGTGLRTTYMTIVAPLIAGCVSRTVVATLFSPLELFRTRLQSHPNLSSSITSAPLSSSSILRATLSEVRSRGITSLWKGLGATLWRDVPFSGIYWASYEIVRRTLTGGRGLGEKVEGHQGKSVTIFASFASGSISGCVAAILTNPFDVVKTKRQAELLAQDPARTRSGTWKMLQKVWNEEGMVGMRKGLTPRLAKVVPACGIMIASYEGLAQVLADSDW